MDGTRHLENVYEHYVGLSFVQFIDEIGDILLFRYNPELKGDLYIHVVSYLTGGLLGLPGLFFVVIAFVFGYFFAGSMFRLFQIFPTYKRSILFFNLAVVFILLMNIEKVNQIRTGTGLWILFYAFLSYQYTSKKKYLWLMLAPPLVHFGYFIMALPAWGVVWAGNRKMIYAALFFISFSTTLIAPQQATNQLSVTSLGERRVQAYEVEEQIGVDDRLENTKQLNWYARYGESGIVSWAVIVMAASFIIFGTYTKYMNIVESCLFSAGLLTKVLSNSTWFLYALTNRSDTIAIIFIMAALLLFWQRYYMNDIKLPIGKIHYSILAVCGFILAPYIIFKTAELIQVVNIFMFFAPFIPWFSEDFQISIREFLGYFL